MSIFDDLNANRQKINSCYDPLHLTVAPPTDTKPESPEFAKFWNEASDAIAEIYLEGTDLYLSREHSDLWEQIRSAQKLLESHWGHDLDAFTSAVAEWRDLYLKGCALYEGPVPVEEPRFFRKGQAEVLGCLDLAGGPCPAYRDGWCSAMQDGNRVAVDSLRECPVEERLRNPKPSPRRPESPSVMTCRECDRLVLPWDGGPTQAGCTANPYQKIPLERLTACPKSEWNEVLGSPGAQTPTGGSLTAKSCKGCSMYYRTSRLDFCGETGLRLDRMERCPRQRQGLRLVK